ncbi:MAG: LuxR C-terminal-related transcriptional regulator [Chloroflexota bacterium]|nr:LuxR C-terminal-related transcriptional regulator [Chloroflexota bacterium]
MPNNFAYDPPRLHSEGQSAFEVWCGIPAIGELVRHQISKEGIPYFSQTATMKVIMDLPLGFALQTLESLHSSYTAASYVLVITFSNCAEYWEDLWELQPNGLIATNKNSFDLDNVLHRASRGEKYRITPNIVTALNQTERLLLRLVARGYPNKSIAQQLGLQEKTVMNALTTVYSKINVKSRTEAILHYWNLQLTAGHVQGAATTASQPSKGSQLPHLRSQDATWEEYPLMRGHSSLTND